MNLVELLLADPSGATAIVTPTATWSRSQLAEEASRVAGAVEANSAPEARIVILADNGEDFIAAYLGILLAGRVAVPLNPSAPAAELATELDVIEPGLVLCGNGHVPPLPEVARMEISTARQATPSEACTPRNPEDIAVLLFTSGTAGMPKAAILTHGNLIANIRQVQDTAGLAMRADDVGLAVLPFFHIFGLNVVIGLALASRAALVISGTFHPVRSAESIRTHGVTVVAAVPAIYRTWLDHRAEIGGDAFATVRLAVSGAAELGGVLQGALVENFGLVVQEGYGLTEASPIVTTTAIGSATRPGSIGPPLPGIAIRLVDKDGLDAVSGDPGEILIKGPNVFCGYWNDREQSEKVLRDGWLHTGDIAVRDDDGWLTLVDRAKDLIIVSGFNVYPGEVELALASHASIEAVAVVGEREDNGNERVVAYVVAKSGSLPSPIELDQFLRSRIARYKIPRDYKFVSELPQTFAGKVLRRALRAGGRADAAQNPE